MSWLNRVVTLVSVAVGIFAALTVRGVGLIVMPIVRAFR